MKIFFVMLLILIFMLLFSVGLLFVKIDIYLCIFMEGSCFLCLILFLSLVILFCLFSWWVVENSLGYVSVKEIYVFLVELYVYMIIWLMYFF